MHYYLLKERVADSLDLSWSLLTPSCWLWQGGGVEIRAAGVSFLLLSLFKTLLSGLKWTVDEQMCNVSRY